MKLLVVGAGRTGAAVTRAMLGRDAIVDVLDSGTSATVQAAAADLRAAGATTHTDADALDVTAFDVVVPSPGVPEHHPILRAAISAGTNVWSEPELAWRLADGGTRMVAVTGTNGKTTTTELIAAGLRAPTGGNIGTPLVSLLDAVDRPPVVVAELSSFQLRFAQTLRPDVAVLLNVAPDHLDWHGDLAAYGAAKARLWSAQATQDTLVVNADDEGARATVAAHPPTAGVIGFTLDAPEEGQVGVIAGFVVANLDGAVQQVVAVDRLGISGPHNVANACAAVAACLAAGAPVEQIRSALEGYRPGRHRLEVVATAGGVTYVDDSKATNPHAAAAALASFPPGRVLWIAGGLGKGLEFSVLSPLIARHVKVALTIGTDGPAIAEVARDAGVSVVEAGTVPAAVAAAVPLAAPGDTVLLAPACASMDQFTDYAQRGDVFAAEAMAIVATHAQGAHCGS